MRSVFLLVTGFCICAGSVSADYANPPDWQNDPDTQNFTHQSWSFDNGTNPSAPDDGGAGNPYGTASFNMAAGSWVDDLGPVHSTDVPYPWIEDRQGGWQVSGPSTGEEWFRIDIPNDENPNMRKEIWFEMTFKVTDLGHLQTIVQNVDLQVYADGIIDETHKFSYGPGPDTQEVLGVNPFDGGFWARFSTYYQYDPQPGSELVILGGNLNDGQYVILDQIDVDTRCVPEPTTMGLLGIGALALIRRRKSR